MPLLIASTFGAKLIAILLLPMIVVRWHEDELTHSNKTVDETRINHNLRTTCSLNPWHHKHCHCSQHSHQHLDKNLCHLRSCYNKSCLATIHWRGAFATIHRKGAHATIRIAIIATIGRRGAITTKRVASIALIGTFATIGTAVVACIATNVWLRTFATMLVATIHRIRTTATIHWRGAFAPKRIAIIATFSRIEPLATKGVASIAWIGTLASTRIAVPPLG